MKAHMEMEEHETFKLLDESSNGEVSRAGLFEVHEPDERALLEAQSCLPIKGSADNEEQWDRFKDRWMLWRKGHEAHFVTEEKLMMPLTQKTGATPTERSLVVHYRLVNPAMRRDPEEFKFHISFCVEYLSTYGSSNQNAFVATSVYVRGLKAACSAAQWGDFMPLLKRACVLDVWNEMDAKCKIESMNEGLIDLTMVPPALAHAETEGLESTDLNRSDPQSRSHSAPQSNKMLPVGVVGVPAVPTPTNSEREAIANVPEIITTPVMIAAVLDRKEPTPIQSEKMSNKSGGVSSKYLAAISTPTKSEKSEISSSKMNAEMVGLIGPTAEVHSAAQSSKVGLAALGGAAAVVATTEQQQQQEKQPEVMPMAMSAPQSTKIAAVDESRPISEPAVAPPSLAPPALVAPVSGKPGATPMNQSAAPSKKFEEVDLSSPKSRNQVHHDSHSTAESSKPDSQRDPANDLPKAASNKPKGQAQANPEGEHVDNTACAACQCNCTIM
jgi:hypothetical protein